MAVNTRLGAFRIHVEVRTFPPEDEPFRKVVADSLPRFDRTRTTDAIPGRLTQLLRRHYPVAQCILQSPLAVAERRVLYVYRDGAAVPASEPEASAPRVYST
jgi:hypothetical protein